MASTLKVDEDSGEEHPHGEPVAAEGEEFLHPWAREMFKKGLSFSGNERSKLFLGRGDGCFEDLSDLCGGDSPLDGRSLLAADFDDDGDVDLFAHNIQGGRHSLLRNERNGSGFVKLRLRATTGQHEAIGATVIVRTAGRPLAQVLSRGAGFSSCQAAELVFGLGTEASGGVSVRWPGGALEEFGQIAAGGRWLLVEGSGKPAAYAAHTQRLVDPLPTGLKLELGQVVSKLTLVDKDGQTQHIDPAELAGENQLYLNFWASYCRPCVRELPRLDELHKRADKMVLAVSVDVPSDRDRVYEVIRSSGTSFPVYTLAQGDADNEGGLDEVIDLLRLPIPTTLVIGAGGRLQAVISGPIEGQ